MHIHNTAVHDCKTIPSLCFLKVHKLPNLVLTDLWFVFLLNLPTVIYSHPSPGSSTTQCSCLISDSVNSIPLWLMSHEFTLLTPLSLSLSLHRSLASRSLPASLRFSIIIKSRAGRRAGTQRRNRLQHKRPFSASGAFPEPSLQSQAFSSLPLQGLCVFLHSFNSVAFRFTDHNMPTS